MDSTLNFTQKKNHAYPTSRFSSEIQGWIRIPSIVISLLHKYVLGSQSSQFSVSWYIFLLLFFFQTKIWKFRFYSLNARYRRSDQRKRERDRDWFTVINYHELFSQYDFFKVKMYRYWLIVKWSKTYLLYISNFLHM